MVTAPALDEVVSKAGLEWVQTQARPASSVEPAQDTPPPPRLGRVRRPRATSGSEPMQQVETRPEDRGTI